MNENKLKMAKKVELNNRVFDERPWGNFEQFTLNEQTTVKIISVKPNEKLSVQRHKHRDEFWKILDAPAKVTLDNESFILNKNEEVFIKKGQIHSIEGLDEPTRFIEIAFGKFDEQDIERLEDRYGRK